MRETGQVWRGKERRERERRGKEMELEEELVNCCRIHYSLCVCVYVCARAFYQIFARASYIAHVQYQLKWTLMFK